MSPGERAVWVYTLPAMLSVNCAIQFGYKRSLRALLKTSRGHREVKAGKTTRNDARCAVRTSACLKDNMGTVGTTELAE